MAEASSNSSLGAGSLLSGLGSAVGNANPASAIANAVSSTVSAAANAVVGGMQTVTERVFYREQTKQIKDNNSKEEYLAGFKALKDGNNTGTNITAYILMFLIIAGMITAMFFMNKSNNK